MINYKPFTQKTFSVLLSIDYFANWMLAVVGVLEAILYFIICFLGHFEILRVDKFNDSVHGQDDVDKGENYHRNGDWESTLVADLYVEK